MLRKLIRRAVRHGELLTGTDQDLAQALIDGDRSGVGRDGSALARRRHPAPAVTPPAKTIDQEARKFSTTLRNGVEQLQHLADERPTFDGDLAFRSPTRSATPSSCRPRRPAASA